MRNAPFTFRWHRGLAPGVYAKLIHARRWHAADNAVQADSEPVLVLTGQGAEYDPFADETGLFLNFAGIDPTESSIRAFVHEYGTLGLSNFFMPDTWAGKTAVPPKGATVSALGGIHGEAIADVQAQIKAIRKLVDQWTDGSVDQRFIRHMNGHISGRASPQLVQEDGSPALRFEPKTLIDAIWLQFAYAVGTGYTAADFRPCEICGKRFFASSETNQRYAYCSVPCKLKAYRRRQSKAKELHASGKTAAQIAKLIGSDVSTIKNWLSEKDK